MRAMAAPMIAMSTRCMASAPIVAPTSSTMLSPRSVGHRAAIAGRSICAMVLRQIFAIAMSAPVLPAETAASASPSRTAWIASHMEDLQPPGAHRLARLVVHAHRDVGVAELDRVLEARASPREAGRIAVSSPKMRKRRPGWRSRASAAPGTTTAGP